MKLVIASRNVHKIRECRAILKKLAAFDILSLLDFPHYTPPPEAGFTFEENAIQKAVHAAQHLNCWTLADDSGLVVPSLAGRPGVFSARYAGDHATDAENRHKLLKEMIHLENPDRVAYFECSLAIATPDGLKKCIQASCEGSIIREERGSQGFGYDPIFIKHEYSKTFAELDEETKNRISHRRKALDKILLSLQVLA